MPDHFDIVETDGSRKGDADGPRKFLSVWYQCCSTYGRLYRNKTATAYEGRCPRCGSAVKALIGPGGTTRRMFTTTD